MGDYLLMKNSILILSLLTSATLLSNELSWVNEQVEAIKPARKGMKSSDIRAIKDPFIFLEKNRGKEDPKSAKKATVIRTKTASSNQLTQTAQVIPKNGNSINTIFTLSLIMNNAAMINGQWYKLGEKIDGYKITELDRSSVLLTKKKKQILLSTKSVSQNLHFKNK